MHSSQVTDPHDIAYAEQMDNDDPLADLKKRFFIPRDSLYFA